MDRTPVESSNLKSVGYDRATSTLEVEFQNGKVFQYADVPMGTHAGLMAAESPGAYFARNVKPSFTGMEVESA